MKERPRVLICVWDREIDPWGLLAGQLSLFNDSRPVRPYLTRWLAPQELQPRVRQLPLLRERACTLRCAHIENIIILDLSQASYTKPER